MKNILGLLMIVWSGFALGCTIAVPAVNVGTISTGLVHVAPAAVDVNCPTGMAWMLTSPISNPLVVGINGTANQIRLETLAGATIDTTGVGGTGTGAAQTINLQLRISNTALGPMIGSGSLSGSPALTITY